MSTKERPRIEPVRPAQPRPPHIPRLENGDCLSRGEFERRYAAMPDVKAELLEGVVYMSSPVGMLKHGMPHMYIDHWLCAYHVATPHTKAGNNATVRLGPADEPQPDSFLLIDAAAGGTAHIGEDDYVEGPPELVIEVSSSTASRDLNKKKAVYQKRGILEYIVWRVEDSALDWFVLCGSQYEALPPVDGVLKSGIFPGLWLDAAALLSGQMQKTMAVLQAGIASPEHDAFAKALQERAKKN